MLLQFYTILMNHLYVLMSLSEDMDMLWIKFLRFVSVFSSANLSCSILVHIFKDKHKVVGDINSLTLLVYNYFERKHTRERERTHRLET